MTEGISLFLSRDLPKVLFYEDGKYEVVSEIKRRQKIKGGISGKNLANDRGERKLLWNNIGK